jgi:pimeloyl-ACP methyl ester carboxylesterase
MAAVSAMSSNRMLVRKAFSETEGRVFSQYHLSPQLRRLRLGEPPLGVRLVEVGSGEPIPFTHRLSLCAAHWAPLIAGLGERRRIVIDMPGHGGTDRVDYRHVDLRSRHTTFLTSLLDALGLDLAHIVGHSYGGVGISARVVLPQHLAAMTGYSATIFSLAIARGQPRTVGAELPARAAWPDDSALVMTAARDTAELARRARTLPNLHPWDLLLLANAVDQHLRTSLRMT